VGLTPRSSGKRFKTWRINPPPHSCPCPLKLMMWLLLTRSTCLSSLINTSLSQDSYLTQPCLLARPTFPHLPPLPMQLSPMLLPIFALLQSFSLQGVTESEVLKRLLKLDPPKKHLCQMVSTLSSLRSLPLSSPN
jgi:hypothetical protein